MKATNDAPPLPSEPESDVGVTPPAVVAASESALTPQDEAARARNKAARSRLGPVMISAFAALSILTLLLCLVYLQADNEGIGHRVSLVLMIGSLLVAACLTLVLAHLARDYEKSAFEMADLNRQLQSENAARRQVEEQLRAGEEMFRHLAEDSLDLVCRHAEDGTFTYVSPVAHSLLGQEPSQLLGRSPLDIWHPRAVPAHNTASDATASDETPQTVTIQTATPRLCAFGATLRAAQGAPVVFGYDHPDGGRRWLEVVGHEAPGIGNGAPGNWQTMVRDISGRVREDERRQRVTEGLGAIVEATDELIAINDETFLLRRAVELAREKLGLERCRLFLASPDGKTLQATFGTDAQGRVCDEHAAPAPLTQPWQSNPRLPNLEERWKLTPHMELWSWDGSEWQPVAEGWLAATLVVAGNEPLGVLYHDTAFSGAPHDPVQQQLVSLYGSLLGAIIARERAATHLVESQRNLQTVMQNSPLFFYSFDRNERCTVAMGHALAMVGIGPEVMMGRKLDEIELGDHSFAERVRRTLGGETVNATVRYEGRDLQVRRQPTYDASGQLSGMVAVGVDITERVEAEEQLQATTVLQNAILSGVNYAIIAGDADGTIQLFNRAAEEMLGYAASDLLGTEVGAWMRRIHDPAEIEARARAISEELGEPIAPDLNTITSKAMRGGVDENEWTFIRRDGTRFPGRLSISALRDDQGRVTGYVGIIYDLTETRRVEHLKNEFVSVVSHELRTPLTSIRGSLGLLEGGVAGALSPVAMQMVGIARKNAERLVVLINDILDIEKIESGKMRFDWGSLSLAELLDTAVEGNVAYGEPLNVALQLEVLPLSLRSRQLWGDEGRLIQVLSNLLSNAMKFTPFGGKVTLRASLIPGAAKALGGVPTDRVRISVCDQGPGVPESFVPHLFERFAQAEAASTRAGSGTGLGLAIARAIVEKHGGVLAYLPPDMASGCSGATFYCEMELLPATGNEIDVGAGEDAGSPTLLVCEDDRETAQLLRILLESDGYRVEVAPTLARARELLASSLNFHALLLDLNLPDGHGLDLLDELHAHAGANEQGGENVTPRALPVIVISAHCEDGKLRGQAFDVADWIEKPIKSERVLGAIARTGLKKRSAGQPRLLHVEDDADVRQVIQIMLSERAEVVPANSLAEARRLLATQHFDLALLDIGLPDGSGLSLLSSLTAQEPPIPVVLFSAREETEVARGVLATHTKSRTSNAELQNTIERLLNSS